MLIQFILVLPEVGLILLALSIQVLSVCVQRLYHRSMVNVVIWTSLIILLVIILISETNSSGIGFNDSFVINQNTGWYKALVLGFTTLSLILYKGFCQVTCSAIKMEYITLMLLSTVGIFIAISARNLLLLFCGLELQALSGYALVGLSGDSKALEGAIKYFVLGALLGCISLLGVSFLYGVSGSLQFKVIGSLLHVNNTTNIVLVIGIVLLLCVILFKLSAAPLHSWTPDVYEGSNIVVATYFATAQKVGMVIILFNMITLLIQDCVVISVRLVKIVAVLSMIIGGLGAIKQQSLKRLMAYSTILNIGYVLTGIVTHTSKGMFAALMYLCIYALSVLSFFTCLVVLFGNKSDLATFEDLKAVGWSNKAIAVAIAVVMFSMISVPPLAGFFGKYYILYQLLTQQEFMLAVTVIITSVISSYYYLKVISVMYFTSDIINDSIIKIPTKEYSLSLIATFTVGFILCFSLVVNHLLSFMLSIK